MLDIELTSAKLKIILILNLRIQIFFELKFTSTPESFRWKKPDLHRKQSVLFLDSGTPSNGNKNSLPIFTQYD